MPFKFFFVMLCGMINQFLIRVFNAKYQFGTGRLVTGSRNLASVQNNKLGPRLS
jgi:hypothetical protein